MLFPLDTSQELTLEISWTGAGNNVKLHGNSDSIQEMTNLFSGCVVLRGGAWCCVVARGAACCVVPSVA